MEKIIKKSNLDFFETEMDDGKLKIGEEKIGFKPKVKMLRWNDEENLEFEHEVNFDTCSLDNDCVKSSKGDHEIEIYAPDKKTMKFITKINNKPLTNKISFYVKGYENFNFMYQGALSQDEIDEGCFRPENVVGSYAVYHKTKKDYRFGGTNYKTGKFCHIYRPKFIDKDGKWQWGVLSYSNGILTITIDQNFLDTAKYPIKENATFGYTSEGGTSYRSITARTAEATLSENGTATTLTSYIQNTSGAASYNFKHNIYDDNGGNPNNTQTNDAEGTVPTSSTDWYDANINDVALTSGTYHFGFMSNDTAAARMYFHYDGNAGYDMYYDTSRTYAAGFEDPFGTTDKVANRQFSIYCTYTTGGAPTSSDLAFVGMTTNTKYWGSY